MNAKYLRKLIEHGHQVAVKGESGSWKIFMYVNKDGRFQGSVMDSIIQKSLDSGISDSGYYSEEIENKFADEYKIVTPAPKLLEVGDRCMLIDSFKETKGFREEMNILGKELRIASVGHGRYRVDNFCGDRFRCPSWAIAPLPYQEEKKERKLMMTDTEREEFQKKNDLDDNKQDE